MEPYAHPECGPAIHPADIYLDINGPSVQMLQAAVYSVLHIIRKLAESTLVSNPGESILAPASQIYEGLLFQHSCKTRDWHDRGFKTLFAADRLEPYHALDYGIRLEPACRLILEIWFTKSDSRIEDLGAAGTWRPRVPMICLVAVLPNQV